ncbi:hypothetical protein F5X68DRAFT_230861 [Plectosphaerella plurivora]|uniref:Uncharacterized protein n=1 Tax=Plectosphaerella plurivora TaxID=936078 RepID=A0A9P8VG07_9PEZI|nr:hypothetical protein F5X68DRAFT_230861 [Plectosphaerella plurivora]
MSSHNFGVIEIASKKTTSAPGWAKRARNQTSVISGADLSARQESKVRKDLEALDRDTNRDVNIAIPSSRPGPAKAASKSTPNIRKIIQSQKTFANHLDDYNALVAAQGDDAAPQAAHQAPKPSHPNQHTKKLVATSQNKKKGAPSNQPSKRTSSTTKLPPPDATDTEIGSGSRSRRGNRTGQAVENEVPPPGEEQDLEMTDVPEPGVVDATPAANDDQPPTLSRLDDDDPLLASIVPDLPDSGELDALLNHLQLTYARARATWGPQDQRYPVRTFCDVCGYWGRVHREDCITRYGL